MDIELEKIFSEIGRLHMQVAALQEALAKARTDLAAHAPPTPPKE